MLWDDYVEDITENIRSRHRAREVRREVRDHLLCLREQFIAEGMSPSEAEARAMETLGPADLLARQFRELDHPMRPLWPVAVSAAGILWGLGSLGVPGAETGTSVFLLFWAAAWGLVHARSFGSLVHAFRHRRPITSGVEWARLLPGAWRFGGAGAVFGLAFALLYGLADLAFFGVLLAMALGVAAWVAAVRRPWFPAEDSVPLRHPLSTGLAAAGVLLVMVPVLTFIPGANFAPAFAFYAPFGQHLPYAEVLRLSFGASIPASGVIAALYFSAACVARWVFGRIAPAGETPSEATLSVE